MALHYLALKMGNMPVSLLGNYGTGSAYYAQFCLLYNGYHVSF